MSHADAFDKAARQLEAMEPRTVAAGSGAEYREGRFELRFFNRTFHIAHPRVAVHQPSADNEPTVWLQLTLLHYLINAARMPASASPAAVAGEWVAYRQLAGSPAAGGIFQRTVIAPIVSAFGQDADGFRQACLSLGGVPLEGRGDAAFTFRALPRLPLLAVLYLGEEGMSPSASVLYGADASGYLPAEALILVGEYLSAALQAQRGIEPPSGTYLF